MMTWEEAIAILQEKYDYCKSFYDLAARPKEDYAETAQYLQALQVALTALRPVSREQVEKVWRGEWNVIYDELNGFTYATCSKCRDETVLNGCFVTVEGEPCDLEDFCPHCGAPMTDEAVEMVMERLEAMKDGKDD